MKMPRVVGFCSMQKPMPLSLESHHQPVSGVRVLPLVMVALASIETVCGLPEPLEVTVMVPDCLPAAVGKKNTVKLHVAPLWSVVTQLLLPTTKLELLLLVMDEIVTAPPDAVTVTVWPALVVFTA